MDKSEVAKHIDAAYRYASSIAVAGDDIDKLAAARQQLRAAYKLLTEEKEGENG